ncbi:hypothetical protein KGY79_08945 [Candidatus Bipolaricaulota bacterium]|nr:hypothetical protein [Candidatus Bipolaricaulota bacterium]
MKKFYLILPLLILFVLPTSSQVQGAEAESSYSLFFVDETRSLEMSMRIQGLVRNLQSKEKLKIEAKSLEVKDPTINPLSGTKNRPYDLVIIVPPTIETGTIEQIWLVTKPLSKIPVEKKERVMVQLDQLKGAVSKAFEGEVKPVGVNDDVIPAYFSTLFLREGYL